MNITSDFEQLKNEAWDEFRNEQINKISENQCAICSKKNSCTMPKRAKKIQINKYRNYLGFYPLQIENATCDIFNYFDLGNDN